MSTINDIFDKVKDTASVAYKKTESFVMEQKQKFDIASMENKLNKAYLKLGKLYYDTVKDIDLGDNEMGNTVNDIKAKAEELANAKEELAKARSKRICPVCGKAIETNSAFCNYCGAQLIFEETEETAEDE